MKCPLSSFVIGCMLLLSSCTNQTQNEQSGVTPYARAFYMDRAAKDEEVIKNGIIEAGNKSTFKGLQYFDPDSAYRIQANIEWLKKDKVIFKTNSERSPEYYTICKLNFKIGDSTLQLIAYSEDSLAKTGLFIPFKDPTNTHDTYGGGRYLELPYHGEKDVFMIDFNKAFNPYCHYNHSYSCPLVPDANILNTSIRAGEKKLYD